MHHDAMLIIRADLLGRIDSLGGATPQPARLATQIDDIRRIAHDYGLEPLEGLAHSLLSALATDHSACLHSYLDLMRDAAGCEITGPEVINTYLAALSLRMGA